MKDNDQSYLKKINQNTWFGGQIGMKFNHRSCPTFQMLNECISLGHDFEDHIHCLSPGVL